MLAWCGPGVIVFKTLDTDNENVHYCGISDKGRTDAFLDRMLGEAEELTAKLLARRLIKIGMSPPINMRLLLRKVREELQSSIRWMLEQSLKAMCAGALEISLAAVLRQFMKTLLDPKLSWLDALLVKMGPRGAGIDIKVLGEAARNTAAVLTIALILDAAFTLVLAL